MSSDLTIIDRFVFFWDGPFSQWHRSPFLHGGTLYSCCEQFMMAEKARVFDDSEMLVKILAAPTPRIQKALGRRVRNFNEATWNSVCRGIVFTANLAKFRKHKDLAQLLLNTGSRTIVEASPVDSIWGIGLAADHPDAPHPDRWRGTNWLGISLMQVRETLRDSAKPLDPFLQQQLAARRSPNSSTTNESAT